MNHNFQKKTWNNIMKILNKTVVINSIIKKQLCFLKNMLKKKKIHNCIILPKTSKKKIIKKENQFQNGKT